MQEYIYDDSYQFCFKPIRKFIKNKKILKVGVGLGYPSYFLSLFSKNVVNLDIHKDKNSIIKDIQVYGGTKIPYKDNFFDVVVCTYVLHHADNRNKLLEELFRVSKDKIVIVEETYTGLFSKLALIYADIKVNFFAKQRVHIKFNNYYKVGELDSLIKNKGYTIELHTKKPNFLHNKELFVIKK